MNSLVIFCAQYLPYILVAVFLLILIFSKKDFREKIKIFIFTAISVFLSRVVITEIIRYFYYVPRPFVNNDIVPLISHAPTASFPSGHAAFFFALATAIMLAPTLIHKWWGFVFFIMAILIGISRVMTGLHWPIDILGGAIIGILSAIILYFPFKKHLQKSPE